MEPIVPRATSGWYLVVPLMIAGSGLGLLVSQLNNSRWPRSLRSGSARRPGSNSAGGSFGLSFGLAFAGAILLAALSIGFTSMAQSSTVLSGAEQQQVAKVLEHDAQVVSNTQLEKQLAGQPQKTQDEIIRINTQARHLALQVALLIPILAGLAGLLISFRMMRLPDPQQSGSGEQMVPVHRAADRPPAGAVRGRRAVRGQVADGDALSGQRGCQLSEDLAGVAGAGLEQPGHLRAPGAGERRVAGGAGRSVRPAAPRAWTPASSPTARRSATAPASGSAS